MGRLCIGIQQIAFGDLFLEDIRDYRIAQMRDTSIEPIFPLWHMDTSELAAEMVSRGLKAIVTCVDTKQAPVELVGRSFDPSFLDDLPASVDPCGERGEFHTFVHDGPMFSSPVPVAVGAQSPEEGFIRVGLSRL